MVELPLADIRAPLSFVARRIECFAASRSVRIALLSFVDWQLMGSPIAYMNVD